GLLLRGNHPIPVVEGDAVLAKPGGGARPEAEGDEHHVGGEDLLAAGDHLGTLAPLLVGGTQARLHHLDALHLAVADDLDGLAVEQELDTLLPGILHLAAGAGHIDLVAAIHTGDAGGALADRGAVAVHGGVAAAEHHHPLAGDADEV